MRKHFFILLFFFACLPATSQEVIHALRHKVSGGGGSSPQYVTGGGEDCTVGLGNVFNGACTATTTAAGRTLLIFVESGTVTAPSSVTDSNGTVTTVSAGQNWTGGGASTYAVYNASAAAHLITVNWVGGDGGNAAIVVVAYSGANTTNALDATPTFYGGTFGMASGGPNCGGATGTSPYTTANSNTSMVSMEATSSATAVTAPTGFTVRETVADPSAFHLTVSDNAPTAGTGTPSAGTAYSLVWGSANNYWGCFQEAIKP